MLIEADSFHYNTLLRNCVGTYLLHIVLMLSGINAVYFCWGINAGVYIYGGVIVDVLRYITSGILISTLLFLVTVYCLDCEPICVGKEGNHFPVSILLHYLIESFYDKISGMERIQLANEMVSGVCVTSCSMVVY